MEATATPPDESVVTLDAMAQAYLQDYVLQQYRTLNTTRPRVEHLRRFFGGWVADAITPDAVRRYQLHRRDERAEAATINRETSALSRMFQIAVRRGLVTRPPLFLSVCRKIRLGQGSSNLLITSRFADNSPLLFKTCWISRPARVRPRLPNAGGIRIKTRRVPEYRYVEAEDHTITDF